MKKYLLLLIITAILSFSAAPFLYAGVYKWTDENGVVHYSDTPVRDDDETEIENLTGDESRIHVEKPPIQRSFASENLISGGGQLSHGRPEIEEFARSKYPNDKKMQRYVYKNQIAAYNYMLTVQDSEIKELAIRKYPNDYSMQKYTYDNQLAAKRYMETVSDSEIYQFSKRKYPDDYSMQKYTYDNQLSAKNYMANVYNQNAKAKAVQKYPNDYSMQKFTYDKSAY